MGARQRDDARHETVVAVAVHRLDAARLFRLALEHGADAGPFHPVAEPGVPFRRIAELIGERLGVPAVSISAEQAPGHFGWLAQFVGLDCPSSSEHTRAVLGWEPTQPGLLADLDHPAYLAA